jgi:hypothetical protein
MKRVRAASLRAQMALEIVFRTKEGQYSGNAAIAWNARRMFGPIMFTSDFSVGVRPTCRSHSMSPRASSHARGREHPTKCPILSVVPDSIFGETAGIACDARMRNFGRCLQPCTRPRLCHCGVKQRETVYAMRILYSLKDAISFCRSRISLLQTIPILARNFIFRGLQNLAVASDRSWNRRMP